MEFVKTPKISKVTCIHQPSKDSAVGTLFLTDRNLIFVEQNAVRERWILYHHIESVEQQAGSVRGFPLIIKTKTFLQLHLIIPKMADLQEVIDVISRFSQPLLYKQLYAFSYRPGNSEAATQVLGWGMYDTVMEYGRMGVPNEHWKLCTLNEEYKLCDTYTKYLYVPALARDVTIYGSAGFRSKQRFPVLSYYHAPKKSALCRCSQPLSGMTKRCSEDEELVDCIFKANPSGEPVIVVDTRPKVNAMANRAAGKGYENEEYYKNASYVSFSIHNIHVMKESLQKMMEVVHTPDLTISGLLQGLESSGWLRHISLIMETAAYVVKFVCDRGISIVVHCSHGWDRTSQTCALACLWMDHHYRTLHGFMALIEKEWLSFGHQFSQRCGHLKGDSKEASPIFTQFLECVWQSMLQYPMSFEFNEQFLLLLHDNLHSCQFGTFLGNSERERSIQQFSAQTYSLWGYVWEHIDDYKNPLFDKTSKSSIIRPDASLSKLRFWRGLYARHICSHSNEIKDDVVHSVKLQNMILHEHIKFLRQQVSDLKATMGPHGEVSGPHGEVSGPHGEVSGPHGEVSGPHGEVSGPHGEVNVTGSSGPVVHSDVTLREQGGVLLEEGEDKNIEETAQQLGLEITEMKQGITEDITVEKVEPEQEGKDLKQEVQVLKHGGEVRAEVRAEVEVKEQIIENIMNESADVEKQGITEETKQEITEEIKQEITEETKQEIQVEEITEEMKQEITEETKQEITEEIKQEITEDIKQEITEEIKQDITEKEVSEEVEQLTNVKQDITMVESEITEKKEIAEEIQQEITEEVESGAAPNSTDPMKGHVHTEEYLDVRGKLRKYVQPIPTLQTEWVALRSVHHCRCGVHFSYSAKKYNCTVCGEVVCQSCGNYHTPLPHLATSNHFRVCKTCFIVIKG